jgi:copper chaperone CopZ
MSAAAPETVNLKVTGMTCAACQIHVQKALEAVPGVASASVNLMAHTAQITSATPLDTATLIAAIHNSGYEASLPGAMDMGSPLMDMEGGRLGLRALLALIAGTVAMTLTMTIMAPSLQQPLHWFLCLLSLAVILFAAPEIYTAALRAARHRATNMNTLVALGTLAAFAASFAATIAPGYFTRRGLAPNVYYEASSSRSCSSAAGLKPAPARAPPPPSTASRNWNPPTPTFSPSPTKTTRARRKPYSRSPPSRPATSSASFPAIASRSTASSSTAAAPSTSPCSPASPSPSPAPSMTASPAARSTSTDHSSSAPRQLAPLPP